MKRSLGGVLLVALAACGCDDAPPQESSEPQYQPSGGGSTGNKDGGGQVAIGDAQSSRENIAESYQKALSKIQQRDWDGAREELIGALHRSQGHEIEKDIRKHLQIVEQGILAQPPQNVGDVFKQGKALFEKKVSIRGTFFTGGKVGKVTYYFFVQTGKERVQCRYHKLELEDKKTVLLLEDGAQVLVRGTLKSPWGSNPDPYLELNYFRLEKLSPEQQAAMDKDKQQK